MGARIHTMAHIPRSKSNHDAPGADCFLLERDPYHPARSNPLNCLNPLKLLPKGDCPVEQLSRLVTEEGYYFLAGDDTLDSSGSGSDSEPEDERRGSRVCTVHLASFKDDELTIIGGQAPVSDAFTNEPELYDRVVYLHEPGTVYKPGTRLSAEPDVTYRGPMTLFEIASMLVGGGGPSDEMLSVFERALANVNAERATRDLGADLLRPPECVVRLWHVIVKCCSTGWASILEHGALDAVLQHGLGPVYPRMWEEFKSSEPTAASSEGFSAAMSHFIRLTQPEEVHESIRGEVGVKRNRELLDAKEVAKAKCEAKRQRAAERRDTDLAVVTRTYNENKQRIGERYELEFAKIDEEEREDLNRVEQTLENRDPGEELVYAAERVCAKQ